MTDAQRGDLQPTSPLPHGPAASSRVERLVALAATRPWRFFAAYFALTTGLYQLALRAPLTTPIDVGPTALDHALPLLPWTAWPYLTYFALMPAWIAATRGLPEGLSGRLPVAAAAVVLGNLALNNLIPTRVHPRLVDASVDAWPLRQIIAGDTPLAALPSGHVSLPVALAVLAWPVWPRGRWLWLGWAALLTVSVLTTRQHHAPDAVAGVLYGGLAAALARRWWVPEPKELGPRSEETGA